MPNSMVCMWRSEDNLQESLLSAVWVLAITQVIGLAGMHRYPLGNLI